MTEAHRPRIYLAGPDVFFPDRIRIFERLVAACERLGLQGVPPWENKPMADPPPRGPELAQRIYEDNVERIRQCDGVIANLVSFRGHEPDSGTVFEVGFAIALGKPVVGYGVAPGSYADRVGQTLALKADERGRLREDGNGHIVEDMGHPLNLMLACSTPLEATAEAALARLASLLRA
jgi:nucleoside 2-deoxyribosyltransferase